MDYKINMTEDGLCQYPMHKHKNYEIMLYIEGRGCMRTGQGDFLFERGTVVIVPPEVEHGSFSLDGFKNISVEGEFNGYFNFDSVVSFSDNDKLEGTTLARLIYENRYENGAYLNSLCVAYISFLTKHLTVENQKYKSVSKVIAEIYENAFNSELDIACILRKSGYSEDYIRSCFKEVTKKTPIRFLTDIRIDHACFLIDVYGGERTLAEIAWQCGYLDYVYFSKKFKEVVGVSPQIYKRK